MNIAAAIWRIFHLPEIETFLNKLVQSVTIINQKILFRIDFLQLEKLMNKKL